MSYGFSSSHKNFSNSLNPQGIHLQSSISSKNYKGFNINDKLWRQSQTTLHLTSPKLSFFKQKRFSLNSIYQNMNQNQKNSNTRTNKIKSNVQILAKKISKLIDQQTKNQLRNKHKSSFSQNKSNLQIQNISQIKKRKNSQIKQQRKKFILNQKNQQILARLTANSIRRQSSLRDRHGNRNNLFEQDIESGSVIKPLSMISTLTDMSSQKGFKTSSKRINLNLPLNYFPGPGQYQIKRYLQNNNKIMSARNKQISAR